MGQMPNPNPNPGLSDADVAAWRGLMAEAAGGGGGGAEPILLVTADGPDLVRLSLADPHLMPLGPSCLIGDAVHPLAVGDIAEALARRGWIEPVGNRGDAFRITERGRSA